MKKALIKVPDCFKKGYCCICQFANYDTKHKLVYCDLLKTNVDENTSINSCPILEE